MKHNCSGRLPADCYGAAVTDCSENDAGQLFVSNGEYASQVAFCPYCGFKALKMPAVDLSEFGGSDKQRLVALFTSLGYEMKKERGR